MTPWLRILSASGRLGINAVSWLSMLSFGNSPFQPPRDPVEIRPIFGLILRIFFLKSIWLWYVSKIRSSQISSNTPCIQCIWGACCCQMLGHFCIRHWCRSAFPCEVADLHRGISGCRAHCQSTQRTGENRIHQDLLKHTMVYQQLSTNLRWVDPDIINSRTMFAHVYIYIYIYIYICQDSSWQYPTIIHFFRYGLAIGSVCFALVPAGEVNSKQYSNWWREALEKLWADRRDKVTKTPVKKQRVAASVGTRGTVF